jgi:hypothetical protein
MQAGCLGGVDLWNGAGCTGTSFGVPVQGTCEDTSGFAAATVNVVLQVAGNCQGSNSVPTGMVTAAHPTTVCCQQ